MIIAAINGLWFLPLIIPAVIVFWLCIVGLISLIGGWGRLARDFPAINRPEGLDLRGRSLKFKPITNYNGCINVTLSSIGIYLAPFWLFRFMHPPLLIPWSNISPLQPYRLLWMTRYYVSINAGGKSMRLDLPQTAEESINRYHRQ